MREITISWMSAVTIALVSFGAVANDAPVPPKREWSFQKVFGTFDRGALQRGLQVYEQVCTACHGMKLVSYRDLSALGLSDVKIKALAATRDVAGPLDDEGNPTKRPAKPSDYMVGPYANDKAARAANNGALPPDLSLIIKARKGGPNYVYALLTGYAETPESFSLAPGMHYNQYFPGHQIAMTAPLSEGLVQYADGTPTTVAQMAQDVTTFLAWTSEPEMEERKRSGVKVLLFLVFFTLLMYAVKRRTWAVLKSK